MKKRLKKIIGPIVESENLIFKGVDIDEGDQKRTITVIIDKKNEAVDVNDCVRISKIIDPILEEEDLFKGKSYFLTVSSPGSS